MSALKDTDVLFKMLKIRREINGQISSKRGELPLLFPFQCNASLSVIKTNYDAPSGVKKSVRKTGVRSIHHNITVTRNPTQVLTGSGTELAFLLCGKMKLLIPKVFQFSIKRWMYLSSPKRMRVSSFSIR